MSVAFFSRTRFCFSMFPRSYSTISVSVEQGLRVITLQRPDKFNAFNNEMYNEVLEDLNTAAEDDQTVVTAITGAGKYFSSGNDLTSFAQISQNLEERKEFSKIKGQRLIKFVDAFIEFPKPIVGVVNGPAIGIGCTILGLLDVVYASEKATFHIPFTALALTPEACSSYTFPKILGPATANEMLLFNRKLTAAEAAAKGFVTEAVPHESLEKEIWTKIAKFAQLPKSSLIYSKALVRGLDRELLKDLNRQESLRLQERWISDEVFNEAAKFLTSRRKK